MRMRNSITMKDQRYEVYSITDSSYKGQILVIGSKGAITHLKKRLRKN